MQAGGRDVEESPRLLSEEAPLITAGITQEIKETIQALADRGERTLAWVIRKLILEALKQEVSSNVIPFMLKPGTIIPAPEQPART